LPATQSRGSVTRRVHAALRPRCECGRRHPIEPGPLAACAAPQRHGFLPTLPQVLFFRLLHQIRSRNPQRLPQSDQCRDGRLPDASLKARYERPINICTVGKLFLRDVPIRSISS